MLKALSYLFYTELLILLRHSQEWLYPIVFFLIVITLFPLAFTPDPAFLAKYLPACVWIAALLGSLLSINHIFALDKEEGVLTQYLLSDIPFSFILITKMFAQWLTTELPLILLIPFIGLAFHLPMSNIAVLMLSLLLGTPILTLIGTLSVALTLGLKQQSIMLGLLMLPLTIPVLIFGVNIVQQFSLGLPIHGGLAFMSGLTLLTLITIPWLISMSLQTTIDNT